MAAELFEHLVQKTDLLKVSTVEESWVCVCDAEMNSRSSDWHSSRTLHKDWLLMVTKSRQEIMMIAFINYMGVVHKLVSVGQTMNLASYVKVL